MRAIEAHGFAGGFALGARQAGAEIVGKREVSEFGLRMYRANLDDVEIEVGDPGDWSSLPDVSLVFGNPPCSGFSVLGVMSSDGTGKFRLNQRGEDSKLNVHMYELVDYAARVRPDVVAFESVANAYSQGRSLMTGLRARLEEASGLKYELTHVLQDGLSVGGFALRRRYFWVASRVPLWLWPVDVDHVVLLEEVIGDLEDHPLAWDGDPDGHHVLPGIEQENVARIAAACRAAGTGWHQGETVGNAVERAEAAGADMSWVRKTHRLRDAHPFSVQRWRYGIPARVVTGRHLERVVHPALDRTMTFRETARIMGFPDSWSLFAARDARSSEGRNGWLGKGIPVQAGRWLVDSIRRSLDGDRGPLAGVEVGVREGLVDVSGSYKRAQIAMFG